MDCCAVQAPRAGWKPAHVEGSGGWRDPGRHPLRGGAAVRQTRCELVAAGKLRPQRQQLHRGAQGAESGFQSLLDAFASCLPLLVLQGVHECRPALSFPRSQLISAVVLQSSFMGRKLTAVQLTHRMLVVVV